MKITILKHYIVGFTFFFLLALNCKKSSSDHRFDGSIQLKLDAEGLEYVQVGVGKYFIYKDSVSEMLDSVVVTQSLLENIFTPAVIGGGLFGTSPAYNSEIFSLTLTRIDATNETIWLDAQTPSALCCPSQSSNNEPIHMSESNGALVFCYPTNSCDSVELISSLTVEGKAYENVIKVIGGNNGTSEYYWAKGTGLIKRVETINADTKTYTLLRNN